MILSLLSLFCSGCNNAPPRHKLILIDISGSNVANINKTIDKVNGVYMDSMPNDTFSVYFFSSVKYLAFEGGRLAKLMFTYTPMVILKIQNFPQLI